MERHDQTLTDERHIRTTPTNPRSSGGFGALSRAPALRQGMDAAQLRLWTMLEPHLTPNYKKETEPVRQQARQNLQDENNALFAKLR